MYNIKIFNKSKKMVDTYRNIETVKYLDILGEDIIVSDEEMLTHAFPTNTNYHLYSKDGNYSIDASIIGTFEVSTIS